MTHLITTSRHRLALRRDERGMTTAEYAVGTVGACGFAGILYKLLTSDWAQQLLQGLFQKIWDALPF